MGRFLFAAALVIVILCGRRASGEEPDAVARRRALQLIEEGAELGRNSQLEIAISKFRQADKLVPRAANDCNRPRVRPPQSMASCPLFSHSLPHPLVDRGRGGTPPAALG